MNAKIGRCHTVNAIPLSAVAAAKERFVLRLGNSSGAREAAAVSSLSGGKPARTNAPPALISDIDAMEITHPRSPTTGLEESGIDETATLKGKPAAYDTPNAISKKDVTGRSRITIHRF